MTPEPEYRRGELITG